MDFLKKNKKVVIGIGIIVAILLVILLIKIFIFPSMGKNLYGNRLDGIDKVRINNDSITKLKDDLTADDKIESVNYHLEGKIINLLIEFKTGVNADEAKELASKTLEGFTKSQKEYYDIQVILTQSGSTENGFPYFGYKNKTRDTYSWSNN